MAAQDCAKTAYDLGLRKVKAYVKGPATAANLPSAQFMEQVSKYPKSSMLLRCPTTDAVLPKKKSLTISSAVRLPPALLRDDRRATTALLSLLVHHYQSIRRAA